MTREKCGLLAVPRTASVQLTRYEYTALVLETGMTVNILPALRAVSYLYGVAKMPFIFSTWNIVTCILYMDYATAMHVRLLKNTKVVFSTEGFRLEVYLFTRVYQTMRETGCLPSVAVQSEREVVRTINTRENILEMVQRSQRLSTRRMASRLGVSRMQVWRTLHEEDLYPYHYQRVQHLEPDDHAQRFDL